MENLLTTRFLTELLVIGLLTVLFGYVAGYIVGLMYKVELPAVCDSWNKHYVMEKTLFLTGVLAHLTLQVAGLNAWYCKTRA